MKSLVDRYGHLLVPALVCFALGVLTAGLSMMCGIPLPSSRLKNLTTSMTAAEVEANLGTPSRISSIGPQKWWEYSDRWHVQVVLVTFNTKGRYEGYVVD